MIEIGFVVQFRYCYFTIFVLTFISTSPDSGTIFVRAKHIEGEIETAENWIFLTRFCFYSQKGLFKYDIEYPVSYAVQKILLYYDSPTQWPAIYKREKTCEQKETVLSVENRQFVNLSADYDFTGCNERLGEPRTGKYLSCSGERRFETARERWWFIAVSNCNSSKGLKFSYRITMTNGDLGDFRYAHFSADEFKILEMSFAFLILHGILLAMSCCSAVILHQRHLLHTTFKIFLVSLITNCFALLFTSLAYSRYSVDGVGLPLTKLWGQILQAISLTEFLLLLLLLAKGYTVTRARLRPISALKLTIFMMLYSVTIFILFVYKEEMFDPGEVLYIYESPAGYGLIALRLLSWGMFIYAIIFTLKHYPEKGAFYYPFLTFFTLWFLAGPVLIMAANFVIDKWVREKVVFGTEVSVSFLGFVIFWCMTLPTMTNINFPYHVRTTQIGVCSGGGGDGRRRQNSGTLSTDCDVRNLDAFVHHNYAPTAPPFTPVRSRMIYDVFFVGSSGGIVSEQSTNDQQRVTTSAAAAAAAATAFGTSSQPPPIFATGRTVHPQLWLHHQDVDEITRRPMPPMQYNSANSFQQQQQEEKEDDVEGGGHDSRHVNPPPYNDASSYREQQFNLSNGPRPEDHQLTPRSPLVTSIETAPPPPPLYNTQHDAYMARY